MYMNIVERDEIMSCELNDSRGQEIKIYSFESYFICWINVENDTYIPCMQESEYFFPVKYKTDMLYRCCVRCAIKSLTIAAYIYCNVFTLLYW